MCLVPKERKKKEKGNKKNIRFNVRLMKITARCIKFLLDTQSYLYYIVLSCRTTGTENLWSIRRTTPKYDVVPFSYYHEILAQFSFGLKRLWWEWESLQNLKRQHLLLLCILHYTRLWNEQLDAQSHCVYAWSIEELDHIKFIIWNLIFLYS